MSQNLSSAAVVIGALRVNFATPSQHIIMLLVSYEGKLNKVTIYIELWHVISNNVVFLQV